MAKLLDYELAGTQRERKNGERRCLIGAVHKNASVADKYILDVVGLSEAISDKFFWIISHAACADLMLAVARCFWPFTGVFYHSPGSAKQVRGGFFRVLPHF